MDAGQTIITRPASAADASLLSELIMAAFSAYPITLNPPSSALKETPDAIRARFPDQGGGIAEIGNVPVGCVLFEPEPNGTLYLGRLAVHPAWRGRGIARALIAFVEDEARRRGLDRLRLSVRIVLTDNHRLFAACGFVEVGREAHPGFSEPTSINMEKRLPDVL
jgi:GNAT superfamily N-acetyltransferase